MPASRRTRGLVLCAVAVVAIGSFLLSLSPSARLRMDLLGLKLSGRASAVGVDEVVLAMLPSSVSRSPHLAPAAISERQLAELLNQLQPVDTVGAEKRRVGSSNDGGYVMVAGRSYDALFSYGIGDNMDFERQFVRQNLIPAYLYDHTIDDLPQHDPSRLITWERQGIGPQRTSDLDTLESHVAAHREAQSDDLFLKMDVEGAEWLSLLATPDDVLRRFKQIVIELHWLGSSTGEAYESQLMLLRRLHAMFHLAHVHGNNYSYLFFQGGYKIPEVIEATYLRRGDFDAAPSATRYPVPRLDAPNNPERDDIVLDFYPFAPAPRNHETN